MDTPDNSSGKTAKLTPEQEKAAAVKAYYEAAPDRDKMAAVVKEYPILNTVFSAANHS